MKNVSKIVCSFNEGVDCDSKACKNCYKCGWNPDVHMYRAQNNRKEQGLRFKFFNSKGF